MTAIEFFYLVANMRDTQRRYFQTRDRSIFIAARALENQVDREIARGRAYLLEQEENEKARNEADER